MAYTVTVGQLVMAEKGYYQDQIKTGAFHVTYNFRWMRKLPGDASYTYITNAIGPGYTPTTADIGYLIVCEEQVYRAPEPNGGSTYVDPTGISTYTMSAPASVVAGSGAVSGLLGPSNISYVGSFALPTTVPIPTNPSFPYNTLSFGMFSMGLATVSGQKRLMVVGHVYASLAGQISIPADGSLSNAFTTPAVSLSTGGSTFVHDGANQWMRPVFDARWDAVDDVYVNGNQVKQDGLPPGQGVTGSPSRGLHQPLSDATKALFSATHTYSYSPVSFIWRRPVDFTQTSTSAIEGPVYLQDSAAGMTNPRAICGYMCNIPSTVFDGKNYRSLLGADTLIGLCGISVVSTTSDGPSLFAFDSNNITATVAKGNKGAVVSGSTTTVVLQSTASSVNGYYTGYWIYIVFNTGTTRFMEVAVPITAYNGATKTATVASWGAVDTVNFPAPTTAMTYKIQPTMEGTALAVYGIGDLAALRNYEPNYVWSYEQGAKGTCFPAGSKTVLSIGNGGGGMWTYSGNGEITGGDVYLGGGLFNGAKTFDPSALTRGPHAYSLTNGCKIWAYDADELVKVKQGTKTYTQSQPYAVFSITLPYTQSMASIAYDDATGRLYIAQPPDYIGGNGAIHVFQITV